MGTEHQHGSFKHSKERSLILALILTSFLFIAEVIGGLLSDSLALISDAAHMLTDMTALMIAFVAIRLAKRAADTMRTFGYYRFEILAAAFNTILLFMVAVYIFYEAYQRIAMPPEIHTQGMLIVAIIGLFINLISMWLLRTHQDHSIGIRSAYLEVWSDMLGSVGVIMGAIAIMLTGLKWIDSMVAIAISLWILPRTWSLLKESINVLLEGVPKGIDLKQVQQALLGVQGVLDIHELHIWAITTDRICLTAHVMIGENSDFENVLPQLRAVLATQFGILHSTLQHERTKCLDEEIHCHFSDLKPK